MKIETPLGTIELDEHDKQILSEANKTTHALLDLGKALNIVPPLKECGECGKRKRTRPLLLSDEPGEPATRQEICRKCQRTVIEEDLSKDNEVDLSDSLDDSTSVVSNDEFTGTVDLEGEPASSRDRLEELVEVEGFESVHEALEFAEERIREEQGDE